VNILPYINFNVLAISPDGRTFVFVGCVDESRVDRASGCLLFVRKQSSIDAVPLEGTEGAESPFFSPDGRWIAFGARGKLKKIDLDSGSVVALADAPVARGGSRGEDGTILFSRGAGGILRVPADGGPVQEVTSPARARKEYDHRWPQILPGGRAVLFEVLHEQAVFNAGSRGHDIAVVDLDTGTWRILIESGGTPRYAAGHVFFGRDGVLYAAPLDLERLGTAAPVFQGVFMWSSPGQNSSFAGNVSYDISRDGALLFSPREARLPKRRLVLVSRDGRFESVSSREQAYSEPHFSPDGRRIAVAVEQDVGSWAAFVVDLESDAWTRVESDARPMAWTPEGKLLLSAGGLSLAAVDGSEPVERLDDRDAEMVTVAREGTVLFSTQAAPGLWDIWHFDLRERAAEPWLATPSWEQAPTFSPDSGWVAYHSDVSGPFEIHVRAHSGAGGSRQVSDHGGLFPRWSRDGREIFFLTQGSLWSVAARTSPTFASDPPRKLFELPKEIRVEATDFYDVSPTAGIS
jgi:serine/threonine-protein kinase